MVWLSIYVFLLVAGLGGTSLLLVVILMEVLSWVFVSISGEVSLKYLLVQSVFMLMGVAFVLVYSNLLSLVFLLKMGLPPFHGWMLKLLSLLDKYMFLFMNTIHKMLPLLFLVKLLSLLTSFMVFITVLVLSLILLPKMVPLFLVFAVSSMMHSGWLVMSGGLSTGIFLTYWILYFLLVVVLLFSISTLSETYFFSLEQSTLSSVSWLILSALPPLMMFWLKITIISVMMFLTKMSIMSITFLLALSIVAYFRVFVLSKVTKDGVAFLVPAVVSLTLYVL